MQNVLRKNLFNQRGVTLIELIAVILILGIIAAIGIPVVFNQIDLANEKTNETNIAIMNDAIARYATLNNGYPSSTAVTSLALLISTINGGTGGPFIDADFPTTKADGTTPWNLEVTTGTVTGIN